MKQQPILVCEDDGRVRKLLGQSLGETGSFEVHAVATGEDACAWLVDHRAELLLLDLELPGMSGLEVVEAVQALSERPEILILTSFDDEARVFEALRRGAAGYLVKARSFARLAAAIDEVLSGGVVIEAEIARRFWNYFASVQGRAAVPYALSSEELEVLRLVARGLSNPEAAAAVGATRRAIKSHLASIYSKMGVRGRVAAVVEALRCGLVEL